MSLLPIATILVAHLCLAFAVPLDGPVPVPAAKAEVNYRLPLTIKPVNYQIILQPYLNETDSRKFTFDGECFIEIKAEQRAKEIRLHMKNLKVSLGEYYMKGSTVKTNLPNATPDNLTDIVVYNLSEWLQANTSYILHYKYVGRMDEDMHGFYRSNYTTSRNVTKWLGSTQFQTNHARRAFPSFDEPKFKATFDLSLIHHRSFKSAGPTPLIAVHVDGEYVTDVYDTTPIMSPYVLAFIVSELNDRSDGQFGVLARPEYYSQTEYSFEVGRKMLQTFDNLFNLSYYSLGNKKMQLAAIPDFSAGAMENWGLLTFRERAVLYDEDHSTLSSQQSIAAVVAHEQAHMWFGDLVTCDWWSYTWLNEGFARYFQYFGTHMVEGHFDLPQQFVVDQLQSVMGMDATNDTNPMTDENTNTPADLSRMFNSISYNKGAAVIRMTKHILGEENFQKALNEYLEKHKFTNTVPADLFAFWKKYWPSQNNQYADNYFDSFTTQVGYPVVTFNRTSETTVQVSQKRFLLKDFDKADPTLSYTVPITYTTSTERNFANASPRFFLTKSPETIPVNKSVKWVMGNIQETGYYRVNYDNNTWKEIKEALHSNNWGNIHELNRAQIVDDVLNFARAGEIDYTLAFDVIEYLKTETAYPVWSAAFNAFNFLNIRLGTDTQDFARYIRQMTNLVYEKLGFDEKANDTALDIYTRTKVLTWDCKFGKPDCISKAKAYFNKDLKANPVPVNIRSVVYCTAMREGSEKDFNKLYLKYKTESVATEETLILSTLGCVRGYKLVTELFNKIMSPEIRRQDKSSVLTTLYSENNENVDVVFKLVDENIVQFAEAMGGYSAVASVVSNMAQRFTTEAQLENMRAFNKKHQDKLLSSISTLESATRSVEQNLEWSKAKLGPVKSFLYRHGRNGATVNSISFVSLIVVALIALIFR